MQIFRFTHGIGNHIAQIPLTKVIAITWLALVFSLGWTIGAIAQNEGELSVTITEIESQAFPQVTLLATMADENGPLTDLTPANFRVLEDGVEVPANAITVTKDTFQGLGLVLVLDTSMPNNDLAEVQTAAKTLLSAMDPRDRVAVISFGDEVNLEHDFTNNTAELQTVIDNLTAGGNRTASHQAIVEAAALTGQLPAGRKAVIVVTDSRDNTGVRPADETISQVQEAQLPLYIVGFGDKVRTDSLKDKVTQTGGQYFTLPNADQVQTTLQEIEKELRQGYRITFLSSLQADNAKHKLGIIVIHQGRQGQAEGSFVAMPGQVTVSLPTLTEGQTVGGLVNLTPEITAPAPPTVEYRLDGQSLVEITEPPYGFEWDSTTVEPGPHTLTVNVVDRAGNKGQVELDLNVVRPVKVAIATPRTEIQVGDDVIIQAQIEAMAELAKVELLLDGQVVASDDTPPYSFSLDSSQYPAGTHLVAMRVEDSLGREATAELQMQFLPPPAPEPPFWRRMIDWFRYSRGGQYLLTGIKWGLAALIIIAIAIIGLILIARAQKRGRQKIYHLAVTNLGNLRSRYQLRAEDPVGILKFQFALSGVNLPQRAVPLPTTGVIPTPVSVSRPAEVPVAAPPPASAGPVSPTGREGVRQTANKARQTGKAAQGLTTFVGDILRTVGYLLPGSAGRSVQRMSQQMSAGRRAVSYATYAPTQTMRAADQLRGQVSQVTPTTSKRETARATTSPSVGFTGTGPEVARPAPRRRETTGANGRQTAMSLWSQTPFIDPGETLTVDLLIAPRKSYRSQHYSFKVFSRAIDPENGPPAPLVVEEGSIQMVKRFWLGRLIPYLLLFIIIVIVALVLFLFLTNLELVGQYLREGLARFGSMMGVSERF